MDWTACYRSKKMTVEQAVELIPRGQHLFVGSGAAEPNGLIEELIRQAHRFSSNTIVHLLTLGPAPYVEERYHDIFRHNAFFIGANVREAVHAGRADYTPVFHSQIPDLIRKRRIPVDVALIQVTPPDAFGYVNLGVSVDVVLAAVEAASLVIAEVNPRMPLVYGSGFLPVSRIDAWVDRTAELPVLPRDPVDDVAREIGDHVAALIDDGSTIQIGIGQIPDATLSALHRKKDLGIWTEVFSDGLVELIGNGNVTGRYKTVEPRRVSASFSYGSASTYAFVDRNPTLMFHPSDYINHPVNIARQHRMVAVNGALQIDLTGQVCADSIGAKFHSGIGGQVDFIRGASMCPGGRPIIAVRSTTRSSSLSKIVPTLDDGAGVVTSRGDVRFVVTEYGVADLVGKSIRERAMSLIAVAHPDHRPELLSTAKRRRYVFADQIEPSPESYPHAYEKDVTLAAGEKVHFRPIRVTDERKMTDLFYAFSDETVYRRWMRPALRMTHQSLLRYLRVDHTRNVAIVIETTAPGVESELLGVGRYHEDRATGFAEIAIVIRDDHQQQGLGTALIGHLADIARTNGIPGFTAQVLASNRPMMHVLHKSGLDVQCSLQRGVYRVKIPLSRRARDATVRERTT